MGMTRSYIFQCDLCGATLVSESGVLPLGWVQRTCQRPFGDGPISSQVPADELEELVFCSDIHEMEWLKEHDYDM